MTTPPPRKPRTKTAKRWSDVRAHERRWVPIQAIRDEIRFARNGIKTWGRDSRIGKQHALAIIACRLAIATLRAAAKSKRSER